MGNKEKLVDLKTKAEKISDEDMNRIESMLEYFKDLKEEDVHVQSESN